jgi:outer membrane protein assembly factor BamE (lipoprotein component of BamABCDE complex)
MRNGRKGACALIVGALAVALALVSTALADAGKIVPGKSIHGVKLGMTRADVAKQLGAGTVGGTNVYYYQQMHYVVFYYSKGHVSGIETTNPKDKTSTGVGIGSTPKQVKAGVKGVKCSAQNGYGACVLGTAPQAMSFKYSVKHGVYTIDLGEVQG